MTEPDRQWVWLPCPDHLAWAPACFLSNDADGRGIYEVLVSAKERKNYTLDANVSPESLKAVHSDSLQPDGVVDMIKLGNVDEPAMLHNLRLRYARNLIYTAVGPILVSVNPYKALPLYTPKLIASYRGRGADQLPPHVFSICGNAYSSMMKERQNQSIVISGESGAGKSEATKFVLSYLTEASGSAHGSSVVAERLLEATPVLEAFGNAKTVRNNNSSRFGKWIHVNFNGGAICGGKINSYLLEKSRIVRIAEGERNYHVFYQLLANPSDEEKSALQLKTPADYHYLKHSTASHQKMDDIDDAEWMKHLREALTVIGLQEEMRLIFRLLSAMLHLGNIEFIAQDDKHGAAPESQIKNEDALLVAAEVLQHTPQAVSEVLVKRTLQASRNSLCQVSRSVEEAEEARDSLSKAIYSMLFDWLIHRINESINQDCDPRSVTGHIGVLDIFGFEKFEHNSFEQFCINFANEKLQQQFHEYMFNVELLEYKAEGVTVDGIVEHVDNQPCLDLIEARGGIISMLDEECVMPKASDASFLDKVIACAKNSTQFKKSKLGREPLFTVVHYAGEVEYNVTQWLDKNRDQVHEDFLKLLSTSDNPFLTKLLEHKQRADAIAMTQASLASNTSGRSRASITAIKVKTVASLFKLSLKSLLEQINAGAPHFIRCIKPNQEKIPDYFDGNFVMAQLQYTGMWAACEIRRLGFPVRLAHRDFVTKFRVIVSKQGWEYLKEEPQVACTNILKSLAFDENLYRVGHSKVLLRDSMFTALQKEWLTLVDSMSTALQASWRCHNAVKAFRRRRRLTVCLQTLVRRLCAIIKTSRMRQLQRLQSAITARTRPALAEILEAPAPPAGGVRLKTRLTADDLAPAHKLAARLKEEDRLTDGLEEACAERDLESLEVFLAQCRDIEFFNATVESSEVVRKELLEEERCTAGLTKGIDTRSADILEEFLEIAVTLPFLDSDLVDKARVVLEEVKAVQAVAAAIDTRQRHDLEAALAAARALNVPESLLSEAASLLERVIAEEAAVAALRDAVESRDEDELEEAVNACDALDLSALPEVVEGRQLYHLVKAQNAAIMQLHAAIAERAIAPLEEAIASATAVGLVSALLDKATALLQLVTAEKAALASLREAIKARKSGALQAAIEQAQAALLSEHATTKQAATLLESVQEEEKCLEMVAKALKAGRDTAVSQLQCAISFAEDIEFHCDEVEAAQRELKRVSALEALSSHLRDALEEPLDMDKLAQALGEAKGYALDPCDEELVSHAQQCYAQQLETQRQEELRLKQLEVTQELQAALSSRSVSRLTDALALAHDLNMGDSQGALAASALLDTLDQEGAVLLDLAKVPDMQDIQAMDAILERAAQLDLQNTTEFGLARDTVTQLKLANTISKFLSVALDKEDCDALEEGIDAALQHGGRFDALPRAQLLLEKLKGTKVLADAINRRTVEALESALHGISEELSSTAEGIEAQRLLNRLRIEKDAMAALAGAVGSADRDRIQECLVAVENLGLSGDELSQARNAMRALDTDTLLLNKLHDAVESQDIDVLRAVVHEASQRNLPGLAPALSQATAALEALVQREAEASEAALRSALDCRTSAALQEALASVDARFSRHEPPRVVNQLRVVAVHMLRTLEKEQVLLAQLRTAIAQQDRDALSLCLLKAEETQLAEVEKEVIAQARQLRDSLSNSANVERRLREAMDSSTKTVDTIKPLIEAAKQAGVQGRLYDDARIFVKRHVQAQQADADLRAAMAIHDTDALQITLVMAKALPVPAATVAAAEKMVADHLASVLKRTHQDAFDERLQESILAMLEEEADQEQEELLDTFYSDYDLEKFPNLRPGSTLVHEREPLARSLLKLNADLSEQAANVSNCVLGYCGDKLYPMAYMLADEIAYIGSGERDLRDEILCQLCRQLTKNPRADSELKCWHLLCYCVYSFLPSKAFKQYLLAFVARNYAIISYEAPPSSRRDATLAIANYICKTLLECVDELDTDRVLDVLPDHLELE